MGLMEMLQTGETTKGRNSDRMGKKYIQDD
jgi:hypothetical protein